MDATEAALALARVRSQLRTGKARQIRERAGISQAEASRAVGTDMSQISRWESGAAVLWREQALKLAKLLDGLEEIIAEEEQDAG